MTVSGAGFVKNVRSAWRIARISAPVRSRICASRRLAPTSGERGRHHDLLEPELEAAVVHHHLEEIDDVRLESECRHPVATDALRVDDPVRAGSLELCLRGIVAGPRDDHQVGAQRSAAQRHVEVVGVGVDGGDEHACAFDAGPREYFVLGDIALDRGVRDRCRSARRRDR